VSLGAVVGGFAPLTYAAPVVGLLLAFAAPPDRVEPIPTIAGGRRNTVIAAVVVAALAVVVWQPQRRFVLTRRNLILSLTAVVTVAAWYGSLGHSFLPIAVLVIVLPSVVGVGRLVAARREGLEYRLLRAPLSDGLGAHRLQLLNVVSCCALVALTAPVGTYAALAVQLTGSYRALLILFSAGLVGSVLVALVPLRRVRLASNLVVAAGTIFLATQLVLVHRPPSDAVTIGAPLADPWWVGQGGRAELINYHHTGPMQSDALDIMQIGEGGIHRPGRTDLAGYYVYDRLVLAPADGVVAYVLDGLPDQPIGSVDEHHPSGNSLVIDIGGGRHVMMGHLRQDSITVRSGDRVREGQPIARVGNSGHSSAPHLHIQAQTLPIAIGDIRATDLPQMLRTLRTYPLLFRDADLVRSGAETRPDAIDPRRGDIIRPIG